jgi:hypothetical protein
MAEIDLDVVRGERENFDPAGHYFRPDVIDVRVDRSRHQAARFTE